MMRYPKLPPRPEETSTDNNSHSIQRPSKGGSTKRPLSARYVFGLSVLFLSSMLLLILPSGPLDLGDLSTSLELLEIKATSPGENQLPAPVVETPSNPQIKTQSDARSTVSRKEESTPISPPKSTSSTAPDDDPDANCPFRSSPLYRKVYVYPTYGEVDNGWSGSILSDAGRNLSALEPWPWLKWERESKENATSHYDINGQHVQYTTELLVRDIITHPDSCLRTYDPEEATLFYVPYLPSVEHHQGSKKVNNMSLSKYGQSIMDILDGKYLAWEHHFGLTSEYWKRKKGADHILVFSEPMHGLWHPRSRRGNFHFVNSQKQLTPPIVISVELSTTFVEMYPKCAAKNILVPYPNTDGRWFNGVLDSETDAIFKKANLTAFNSEAILPAEKELAVASDPSARPIAQYYAAGNHGTCRKLRKSMEQDYKTCSASHRLLSKLSKYATHGMRQATFCPCPGGDSPSAKRMFDALLAGCIPVILSVDFVWPYTKEFDPLISLDPNEFSVKLLAADYEEIKLDETTCLAKNNTQPGLQAWMDSISVPEIQRLRKGVEKARDLYGYYKPRNDGSLPDNPLREGVLPDGGAAHALVNALADRAGGTRWPACEEELKLPRGEDPKIFKC
jgi:hypothetical protein